MGYWPFVTIFVSLVLILFFRRLDKRTINFNKFKKYADKLSEDFNLFLQTKREELKSQMAGLESVVLRAEALLNSIESSSEHLGKSSSQLQSERIELESVRRELEKLKGLKGEIAEEVTKLGKSLPSLKALSKQVDKITMDIAENERTLRNASAIIPTIEKRVQERSDKALEELTGILAEEARGRMGGIIDEYRQSLEMLSQTGNRELEKFNRETQDIMSRASQNVESFMDSLQNLGDRVKGIEEGRLAGVERKINELDDLVQEAHGKVETVGSEAVANFLSRAEEAYEKYTGLLERNRETLKTDIFQNIESHAKDLSSYVTRLEGRVQSLLQSIKDETDKYGEVLSLNAKAHQSEAEMLKERVVAEINEEANRNLLLIKPIVSEMNEKLISYKKEFATLYNGVKSKLQAQQDEFRERIESFGSEVEHRKQALIESLQMPVKELRLQLNTVSEQIEGSVGEAAVSVREGFVSRLREYEDRIHALEGRIGDLKNIADTGQDMIEQRIDSVFQNYRPEIEAKIVSLKEDTEQIYSRERERIAERIGSIVEETDSALKEREKHISEYMDSVDERLQGTEHKLSGQEQRLMENVNRVRIEARQELVRELENLKSLFKEEKDKSVERFKVDLTGIQEKIEELGGRVDGISTMVEDKINDAMSSVDASVREIETSYLNTGDELKDKLQSSIGSMNDEVQELRGKVDSMKEKVVGDVSDALAYFRKDVEKQMEDSREHIYEKGRELQELVNSLAEGAKAELESSHGEAETALHGFETEVSEVQSRIEKRVEEIEQRIGNFEKESTVLKRSIRFKEKVEEDIERFSDIMMQLKEDKKDILSMRKLIDNLKRDEGDISAKVRHLKSEKKLVQDIAKNAEQAIGLITVVDEKIKLIEGERELLERIEAGMREIDVRFGDLKEKADKLGSREKDIDMSIETITKTKDFISSLEQRAELLSTNMKELRDREEDLKSKVSLIDDKTGSLLKYEGRIDEVISRFKEMDSFVADIEQRSKQLQNTREWLARTESRLTNLTKDAERLVGDMQGMSRPGNGEAGGTAASKDGPTLLSRESESKVKTVLTLFEQKWTIPEICKVTKMSRGEVELILELNNR
jgi:DNA repair exonuclease SbcCD ATPase subunit